MQRTKQSRFAPANLYTGPQLPPPPPSVPAPSAPAGPAAPSSAPPRNNGTAFVLAGQAPTTAAPAPVPPAASASAPPSASSALPRNNGTSFVLAGPAVATTSAAPPPAAAPAPAPAAPAPAGPAPTSVPSAPPPPTTARVDQADLRRRAAFKQSFARVDGIPKARIEKNKRFSGPQIFGFRAWMQHPVRDWSESRMDFEWDWTPDDQMDWTWC